MWAAATDDWPHSGDRAKVSGGGMIAPSISDVILDKSSALPVPERISVLMPRLIPGQISYRHRLYDDKLFKLSKTDNDWLSPGIR